VPVNVRPNSTCTWQWDERPQRHGDSSCPLLYRRKCYQLWSLGALYLVCGGRVRLEWM